MPKFTDDITISPETVESRLRPNELGVNAMERAAQTVDSSNKQALRMNLHSAELMKEGIRSIGAGISDIERKAKEHDEAMQRADVAQGAADLEISQHKGITSAMGDAGSEGLSPASSIIAGGGLGPGMESGDGNGDGTDALGGQRSVDPNDAPTRVGTALGGAKGRIDAEEERLVQKYGPNSKAVELFREHVKPRLTQQAGITAANEISIANANSIVANLGSDYRTRAGWLAEGNRSVDDLHDQMKSFEGGTKGVMDTYNGIGEKERGVLDKDVLSGKRGMVEQWLGGKVQSHDGIVDARKYLDSGVDDNIIGDKKKQMYDELDKGEKRLFEWDDLKAKHDLKLQRGAQAQVIDSQVDNILNHKPVDVNKVLGGKEFQNDREGRDLAEKSITEAQKFADGQATHVDQVLNDKTTADLQKRINLPHGDPDRLTDPREINQAWAVDHTLSKEGRNELIKEYKEVQGKEKSEFDTAYNKWFAANQTAIWSKVVADNPDDPNSLTHAVPPSAYANQQIAAAKAEFKDKIAKAQAVGKEWDLIDPSSPDYLGKALGKYKVDETTEKMFNDAQSFKIQNQAGAAFKDTDGKVVPEHLAMAQTIKTMESGSAAGNYNQVGTAITYRSGENAGKQDRAYGAYGVMGVNVGPWTKEVLGHEMTPQEFLASSDAQDRVFKAKFIDWAEKHSVDDAMKKWIGRTGSDIFGSTADSYSTKGGRIFSRLYDHIMSSTNGESASAVAKIPTDSTPIAPSDKLPAPQATPYKPGAITAMTNESERATNAQGYGARMTGSMTVGQNTYQFETGGRGRGSAPLGNYKITGFMTGDQRAQAGMKYTEDAFMLSDVNDTTPGTAGGPPRQGLLIHEWHGGQSLGCIEIPHEQWQKFKTDMRNELARSGGKVSLSLNPREDKSNMPAMARPKGFDQFWHNPATGQYWDPNTKTTYNPDGSPQQ